MITYRNETAHRMLTFFAEIQVMAKEEQATQVMLERHWVELADHKDLMVLDPDYEKYRRMVERDALVIITAREDEKLIGYVVIICDTHLHYKTLKVALEDIHYVDPAYRRHGIFTGMLIEAERVLSERGIKIALFRVKPKSDHGALFEGQGYAPLETVWGKRL